MSLAERRSIREGLSEIFPVLWGFLTLNTDRVIALSEDQKRASEWDCPLAMLFIHVASVIGFSLWVDQNSVPSYHVAALTIVLNGLLIAILLVGPLAIAFRYAVRKHHLALLVNFQLACQIVMVMALVVAALWAIFPQHVRTDLYVFGHGRGEGTAIHSAVCGDLELGVRWYRLGRESQVRLEANFLRLSATVSGNPMTLEEQSAAMESEIGWMQANRQASNALLDRGAANAARFMSTYPSFVQAVVGWGLFSVLMIVFFYIHAFRAAGSFARSMQEMGKARRGVGAALLASICGAVILALLQQRDFPDFDIEPGPGMIAALQRDVDQSRSILLDHRSTLIEAFERLQRYCPNVSSRGLL